MIRREYPREEEQTVKDLQAEITSLSADRDSLDQNIQDLTKEISDYEADVPHANSACSAHPSAIRNLNESELCSSWRFSTCCHSICISFSARMACGT